MAERRLSARERQPLVEVLERVWTAMQAENRRPKTIDGYKEKVGAFLRWFRETVGREPLVADMTLENAQAYVGARLLGTWGRGPVSPSSAAGDVRVLRAISTRLYDLGDTGTPRLAALREPKIRATDVRPKNVRPNVLIKLLAANSTLPRTAPRNETILKLLFDAGPRVSELVAIDRDQVHLDEGYLVIGDPAKGGPVRILPLGQTSRRAVRSLLGRAKRSGPLFMGERGERMTNAGVRQVLARLSEKARVHRVFPHAFRHEASAWYTANGAPVSAKNAVFGWNSRRSFVDAQEAGYTILTTQQIVAMHLRYSPLDHLGPSADASREVA
jgi:site-specific recombinase XerD